MKRVSRAGRSDRWASWPSSIRRAVAPDADCTTGPSLPRRRMLLGALAGGISVLAAGFARADAPAPMPVPRSAGTSSPATPPLAPAPDPPRLLNNVPAPRTPGGATQTSMSTATAPKPRKDSVAVGVYIPGAAQETSLLDTFEQAAGKRMAIVHWYQPWGYTNGWYSSPLDGAALDAVAARGATPMITWEAWGPVNGVDPSHVANILTGAFDAYIDAWAHGLTAFGKPIYLRLFHELNNQNYPWAYGMNGNTAPDLIAAWRDSSAPIRYSRWATR